MPMTSGGWDVSKAIQGKSAAGVVLWQWNEEIIFYYNGTNITSITKTDWWGSSFALFWSQHVGDGWPTVRSWGGVGQSSYELKTQADMQMCVPILGCTQNQYPWVDIIGRGNGTYSASAGGLSLRGLLDRERPVGRSRSSPSHEAGTEALW